MRLDGKSERAVALDRQFLVGSVVAHHHYLCGSKLITAHLVNPSLDGGNDFGVLERVDMVVSASVFTVGREEASVVRPLEGHSEVVAL